WIDDYQHRLMRKIAKYAVKKGRKYRSIDDNIVKHIKELLKSEEKIYLR
ncbi:25474_t:CDS:1, partial [Gigaspora rosea]